MTDTPFLSPTAGYFEILGVGAAVDDETLTARFREQVRRFHPDRFAAADEDDQLDALTSTALVNDAYRTLRDTFTRAEYLLRAERNARPDDKRTAAPQALFAQVLEVQELLMEFQEARAEGDADTLTRLRPELSALRDDFQAAYDALKARLGDLFAQYDAGQRDTALDGIEVIVGERGYLRRVLENLAAVDAA